LTFNILQFCWNAPRVFGGGERTEAEKPASSPQDQHRQIYGFVHMAKTAGTEINGELASHFERVYGNKGFSHDYYQYNSRFRNWAPEQKNVSTKAVGPPGDIVDNRYSSISRGKIGKWDYLMEEGLEDCD
jgi:hypothetical protein